MTQTLAVHLFLGLLWGQLALALAPTWQDGTYYSYGWLVLAATIGFYLLRRQEVHSPTTPARIPHSRSAIALVFLFLLASLIAIASLRLFQGANPYWRLLLWTQVSLTLLSTLTLLCFTEGLRPTRHYLPALLLILVAIPIPSTLELALVQNLTHSVVLLSSDLARFIGIPLEVVDTAFLVRGQPLDVNDRCSGIRSFQSSVAVALLAGELLRLSPFARLLLLLAGMAASFVSNAFRVLSLVQAFFEGGYEKLDARHDPAGMISLTATYGLILAFGFLLDRWFSSPGHRISPLPLPHPKSPSP